MCWRHPARDVFALEASPALIHDSTLVDRFGLEFLKAFIDFW